MQSVESFSMTITEQTRSWVYYGISHNQCTGMLLISQNQCTIISDHTPEHAPAAQFVIIMYYLIEHWRGAEIFPEWDIMV